MLQLSDCVLRELQRERGFDQGMADLLLNPALAQGVIERVLEVSAAIGIAALEEARDLGDVMVFPQDMGTQDQRFVRLGLYRKTVKPCHRRTWR